MISSKAGICPTYVKLAIFTPVTLSLSRILVRASASKVLKLQAQVVQLLMKIHVRFDCGCAARYMAVVRPSAL